jgi:voltage-gated potassium channel
MTTSSAGDVGAWQLVLLALSIYVLGALFAQAVWTLDPEVLRILDWADTGICLVFLADFFHHLIAAPDRRAYLRWGWIDLVSSIPTLDMLRWGRAVRVLRILRALRAVRSVRTLVAAVIARRASGLLLSTALVSFLLVVGAAIAILNLEGGPGHRIASAGDALWWAFEMLISQGSGLYNPVTAEGRLLAVALSISGFVLLGAFVGGVSASVLGEEEQKIEAGESRIEAEAGEILARIRAIDARLEGIERRLEGAGSISR